MVDFNLTPLHCPNKPNGEDDKACGQGPPVFNGFECGTCGFSQSEEYRQNHIRTQDAYVMAIQRLTEKYGLKRQETVF
ncbi:MAG: hypothetical protein A2735_01085 [Candidatus Yanofskybacteria bacterium RIFCSPHIGHO2_01_FULL_41_21]|uniref:Uncharacterized protein n=1 Tax=Candidatus Yanofskybacteria bacterium RIFCSPHIGHO2_01_FULL_41_21 TaxID=1802660 RepID=A0A1F8EC76_9BACT|nr:MAG: hypothetical protein A2735_01085 [Candidatus Yanofskybacteria bacterium RIFCSPHIGHO2_01_FULL_41_21]